MDVRSDKEITVTITFSEREAKILASLIGAMSPAEAEAILSRAIYFEEWIGVIKKDEMNKFTGDLYDDLHNLF